MLNILLGILGGLTAWSGVILGIDLFKHKDKLSKENSWVKLGIIGGLANFFDALGIGSYAPMTASLKLFKQVPDRIIPGTLNVGASVPVVIEAFIFISSIEVDLLTLSTMILAATIGAYFGAGVIAKMNEKSIQFIMGFALIITGLLMLAGETGLMPVGGNAVGLTGIKLSIGIFGNLILGALMTAGVGLYAPCMAMVYLLGMSAKAAFPIMMGSCAFLTPVATQKFVKEGAYDRKAAIAICLCGAVGVIIATQIVKNLDVAILTKIVIGIVLVTGVTMIRSGFKNKGNKEEIPSVSIETQQENAC